MTEPHRIRIEHSIAGDAQARPMASLFVAGERIGGVCWISLPTDLLPGSIGTIWKSSSAASHSTPRLFLRMAYTFAGGPKHD